MTRLRKWLWLHLIFLADRIAPDEAFRCTGFSFEFVQNVGFAVNDEGHGCPIWYSGRADYERAWERHRGGERP